MTSHDRIELDAFARFLAIIDQRMKELGENRHKAMGEAGLETYGDKFCEGNKHHERGIE